MTHRPNRTRVSVQTLTFERAASVCRAFEEQSGMTSAEFFERYRRGEIDGINGLNATVWSAYWQAFLDLRPEPDKSVRYCPPPSNHLVPA